MPPRRPSSPVDLARVALIESAHIGENFPDPVVWQFLPEDGWHGLLRNLPFDQFEEGLVIAAEFPVVVQQRWAHAPSTTHPVTAGATGLQIERPAFFDGLRVAGVWIQLVGLRRFPSSSHPERTEKQREGGCRAAATERR